MAPATSHPLGTPATGVVVTGGASGIGRATALALAEVGRPVAVWDLDGDGAATTAAACRDLGVAATAERVDVADPAAIAAAVPGAEAALGSVGGLVHAAGVDGAAAVDDLTVEGWDHTLAVNLRAGAFLCRELAAPLGRAGPGSAVVLVSSIEAFHGNAVIPAYCASKGGVLGLMRSLAQRFAPEGIRVNAVCPGAVDTPMLALAFSLPGFRDQVEQRTPLGRVADPSEIATAVRFLLSGEASFVTGTHLTVDGGMTSVSAV